MEDEVVEEDDDNEALGGKKGRDYACGEIMICFNYLKSKCR